ncbi:MAG: hypothetical protein ABJJ37_19845, partial [Roseibium sp.]
GAASNRDRSKEYKKLFNEFDKFYRGLDVQFAGGTAEDRKKARKARERKANQRNLFFGFILGFLASALVTLMFNYGMGTWPFDAPRVPYEDAADQAVAD